MYIAFGEHFKAKQAMLRWLNKSWGNVKLMAKNKCIAKKAKKWKPTALYMCPAKGCRKCYGPGTQQAPEFQLWQHIESSQGRKLHAHKADVDKWRKQYNETF